MSFPRLRNEEHCVALLLPLGVGDVPEEPLWKALASVAGVYLVAKRVRFSVLEICDIKDSADAVIARECRGRRRCSPASSGYNSS